jgi:hypothetical protein
MPSVRVLGEVLSGEAEDEDAVMVTERLGAGLERRMDVATVSV